MTLEQVVNDGTVDVVWNEHGVKELFEREIHRAGGRSSVDSIYEAVKAGRHQLWLVLEDKKFLRAAIVTQIAPYYEGGDLICTIIAVVGEQSRSWIPLKESLEDWARRSGCKKIEAWGRRGWKRHPGLKDWDHTHLLLEKCL